MGVNKDKHSENMYYISMVTFKSIGDSMIEKIYWNIYFKQF